MDIEEEIHKILLSIGQDIKIHKIDEDNSVIEIDYSTYTEKLLRVFRDYLMD
jgi:hypothetical protein